MSVAVGDKVMLPEYGGSKIELEDKVRDPFPSRLSPVKTLFPPCFKVTSMFVGTNAESLERYTIIYYHFFQEYTLFRESDIVAKLG
jgi:hypothetical protein